MRTCSSSSDSRHAGQCVLAELLSERGEREESSGDRGPQSSVQNYHEKMNVASIRNSIPAAFYVSLVWTHVAALQRNVSRCVCAIMRCHCAMDAALPQTAYFSAFCAC